MLITDASKEGWFQRYLNMLIGALAKRRLIVLCQAAALALLAGGLHLADANHPSAAGRGKSKVTTDSSPTDLLDFRIFQEPDFDAVIRVSGDGSAIFPMIGRVHVAGMTITQATEMLRQRYMAGYLANPQVNLTVRTYAKKMFTILGQVQRPGTYPIEGNESISLLQAIGMAGGYTRIANPEQRRRETERGWHREGL